MSCRGKKDPAGRCDRCLIRKEHCICPYVPLVETRTRFIIVRHAQERFRSTNTARIAALALPNCTVTDYGVENDRFDDAFLAAPGLHLMFPARDPEPFVDPPHTLVVLDGSWSQARHMWQRIPPVQRMPRFALPPPPAPAQRLRTVLHHDGMSTLEAMAHAVALLEGAEKGELLHRLHALFVGSVLATKGRNFIPSAPGTSAT